MRHTLQPSVTCDHKAGDQKWYQCGHGKEEK